MKRSDAQVLIKEKSAAFELLYNRKAEMKFSTFCFPITITALRLATLSELAIKPEYRYDADGKRYRPSTCVLETDVGKLFFTLEDMDVAGIAHGVRITTGTTIDIRLCM